MNSLTVPDAPSLSTQAIVAQLRRKYLTTARDKSFARYFNRLLQTDDRGVPVARPVVFNNTGETRGVMVIDGPGGGKTTLIRRALDRHPALASTGSTAPWVGLKVPNPATTKSLAIEVLRATGFTDVNDRAPAHQLWAWVSHRFAELKTAVLWLDEAHDLFRKGSETELMLNTLKWLMQGPHAVIVVLSGVESLGRIAGYDDQVRRRFSRLELPSVADATDGARLQGVLGQYCAMAGLQPPAVPDLTARLIHASRGRFGRCIETMINAIEIALMDGDAALGIEHFAEAFAMAEGCAPGDNVFLAPAWFDIDLTSKPLDLEG